MEEIQGQITRIVYRSEETGWTVLELTDESGEEITAVGVMPLCAPGEEVRLMGGYVEHRQYGLQFQARSYQSVAPATFGALENYLASGLIKGVGQATAKRIVQAFGMDTLRVLEQEPDRLLEISGIGRSRMREIATSFFAQRSMREVVMTLQGYGLTVRQALKLNQLYGDACLSRIQENPYRMVEEVEGIGFKTADKIAANMGVEPTSRMRLRAGVTYALQWARQEGHTYLPRETLLDVAANILQVQREPIEDALLALQVDGALHFALVEDTEAIYLPRMYYMEADAARRLRQHKKPPKDGATLDLERELAHLEKTLSITLATEQRRAVISALTEGAMVITGGPGTGKTTILQFILRILQRLGLEFTLCAPTGRAAKRMTEATGFDASTIHRLLEYGGEGQPQFARNEEEPLWFDVVVVDEMSMVDLPLFFALLSALPEDTRLVMVGDADQLPPVGAGTVLHDIIASGVVTVIRLADIYRQADRSGIAQNARRINLGEEPQLEAESDFLFMPCGSREAAAERVVSLSLGNDSACSFQDPYKDVQVLAPMKKGPLGVRALNARLQQALNPPERHKLQREYGETVFREGDKVMQIKNNYRLEWQRQRRAGAAENGAGVYNGDLGTIYRMDMEEQTLEVLFDDERLAVYAFTQLEELELAYCISIHKSQGSEFPVVLLPLMGGPPMLTTRNLLYTAVTRARNQVVIVGDWQSVLQMVENRYMRKRYSALGVRLKEFDLLLGGREEKEC